ncbi:MAG: hypothetical protein AB7E52_02865 [Bdellovibrionales bacterium]
MLSFEDYDELWARPTGSQAPDLPTGKGTKVIVIDGAFWAEHPAYASTIDNVWRVPPVPTLPAHQMHGAAVVSLLTAVAPETKVDYLETRMGWWDNVVFNAARLHQGGAVARDSALYYLSCIKKSGKSLPEWTEIYARNTFLSALYFARDKITKGHSVDAVSMSQGWANPQLLKLQRDTYYPDLKMPAFYWDLKEAFSEKAFEMLGWFHRQNIPVFSSCSGLQDLFLCDRSGPLIWTKDKKAELGYLSQIEKSGSIGLGVADRRVACFSEKEVRLWRNLFYRSRGGGVSWAIPHLVGMFLLARQKAPDMTYAQFAPMVRQSARMTEFGEGRVLPTVSLEAYGKKLNELPLVHELS